MFSWPCARGAPARMVGPGEGSDSTGTQRDPVGRLPSDGEERGGAFAEALQEVRSMLW